MGLLRSWDTVTLIHHNVDKSHMPLVLPAPLTGKLERNVHITGILVVVFARMNSFKKLYCY